MLVLKERFGVGLKGVAGQGAGQHSCLTFRVIWDDAASVLPLHSRWRSWISIPSLSYCNADKPSSHILKSCILTELKPVGLGNSSHTTLWMNGWLILIMIFWARVCSVGFRLFLSLFHPQLFDSQLLEKFSSRNRRFACVTLMNNVETYTQWRIWVCHLPSNFKSHYLALLCHQ